MAKKDDRWISLSTTSFNKTDIEAIKQIEGRKWQPEGKVWLIPYSLSSLSGCGRCCKYAPDGSTSPLICWRSVLI